MNIFVLWSIAGIYGKTHKIKSREAREKARIARARKSHIDGALCFSRYAGEHNFYYHDVRDPITDVLKDTRFDAVIFDTTASSLRCLQPADTFLEIKERYGFIADWDSVKIAFPQDEYDFSAVFDDWMADYGFDVIYSTQSQHAAALYPRMSKRAVVLPALTGYVNDIDIESLNAFAKPFAERTIDIGYRARLLPAQYGRFGQMKGLVASRMLQALNGYEIVADISTQPDRVFLGDEWQRFLGDCRFCLGTESGSGIWDPHGKIAQCVTRFTEANPDARFEDVEAACFPGEDGRLDFSTISPRIFEAAIMRSGQILVEGDYVEELEPWRHYLPIDEYCESAPEVLARLSDRPAMERMIGNCYDVLIATPRYRYSTHVAAVMAKIAEVATAKHVQATSCDEFRRRIARHKLVSDIKTRLDRKLVRRIQRIIPFA